MAQDDAASRPASQDVKRFYAEVGRMIREARGQRSSGGRRLSQTQLAHSAGLTRTSVANIESGRQKVLLHTLVVFAEALGVDPDSLIPPFASPPDLSASLDAKQRHFVEAVLKTKSKRR